MSGGVLFERPLANEAFASVNTQRVIAVAVHCSRASTVAHRGSTVNDIGRPRWEVLRLDVTEYCAGRTRNKMRLTRHVLGASIMLAAWAMTGTAQSPNAFGIPSADAPAPASSIRAVPG